MPNTRLQSFRVFDGIHAHCCVTVCYFSAMSAPVQLRHAANFTFQGKIYTYRWYTDSRLVISRQGDEIMIGRFTGAKADVAAFAASLVDTNIKGSTVEPFIDPA